MKKIYNTVRGWLQEASARAVLLIYAVMFVWCNCMDVWHTNRNIVDAPSICAYLPAVIIHRDLSLAYVEQNPEYYKDKLWYYRIENGNRLIKSPPGISIMLAPFFIAGHFLAIALGAEQSGYSLPYQNAMAIGVLLYLLVGLLYLRRYLLFYFDELSVAVTLCAVVLATNLMWYATFEPFMSHAISFMLISGCMYHLHVWLRDDKKRDLLFFAAMFGMCCLIRPLSVTLLLFFGIMAYHYLSGPKLFAGMIMRNLKYLLAASGIFIAIMSVQFFYWKYITGHWFYDVYINEHFVPGSPQVVPFLFSFRKGVFLYSPVFLFSLAGYFFLYQKNRALSVACFLIFAITVYILSSWWAWSYGISWGMRPLIDIYPVMSISMAAAMEVLLRGGRIRRYATLLIISLLIVWNVFQTWQFKNGLIHFDDMSRRAYFKGLFQTSITDEWRDLLQPYQWERRLKGLPQIVCNKEYMMRMGNRPIYLRAKNLKNIAVNERARNVCAAYSNGMGAREMFTLMPLGNRHYVLKLENGNALTYLPQYENIIAALPLQNGNNNFEVEFINDNSNEIALRAANGKYVSYAEEFPHILSASAGKIGKHEIFRYMVKDE